MVERKDVHYQATYYKFLVHVLEKMLTRDKLEVHKNIRIYLDNRYAIKAIDKMFGRDF